jgi:hypothetical protein
VRQQLGGFDEIRMDGIGILALFEFFVLLNEPDDVPAGNPQSRRGFIDESGQRHARLLDEQQIHRPWIRRKVKKLASVEGLSALTQAM